MAKYKLRLEARILREQGVSVKEISKKLKVSKKAPQAFGQRYYSFNITN